MCLPGPAVSFNNRKAEFITLACGAETIQILVRAGLPVHVVDSTRILIPTTFSFVGMFVDLAPA